MTAILADMWLLQEDAYGRLKQNFDKTDPALAVSALSMSSVSQVLSVTSGVATIAVKGPITNTVDLITSFIFGRTTTWPAIRDAIASAEADPSVTSIDFDVDSPGGTIAGMFDTMSAIAAITKPTRAIVTNHAASAAFALVSQVDTVVATSRSVSFGSVGVVVDTFIWPEDISIASTNAPKKRPDLKTEEGRAIVREELDELHNLMVEEIARGRKMTVSAVNSDFGQGGMMLADKALAAGMIDSITTSPSPSKTTEPQSMDISRLITEHPEVYDAAVAIGVTQERDRVKSHLKCGAAANAIDLAIAAINAGGELDAVAQADYFSASLANRDRQNISADVSDAAGAANNVSASASENSLDDLVASDVIASLTSDEGDLIHHG